MVPTSRRAGASADLLPVTYAGPISPETFGVLLLLTAGRDVIIKSRVHVGASNGGAWWLDETTTIAPYRYEPHLEICSSSTNFAIFLPALVPQLL